jgi:RNA polymerase sigma-70 factor, ECF subfamily
MDLSDQDLVERCRRGSGEDFRTLVERYQGPLYAFVALRLQNPTLARDAAEEAFVRAYFALDTLRQPAAFHSWLLGIAGRVALEYQRAEYRRRVVATPIESLAGPAAESALPADSPALDHAIAGLPELPHRLILLRYFENLSCQEIADRLRLPLGTVTKTLSRAYATLRQSLAARTEAAPLEKTT